MAKKTYRVAGTHPVFGAEPGSTVTVDIPQEQESRLIDRGSLKPVHQDTQNKRSKEQHNG